MKEPTRREWIFVAACAFLGALRVGLCALTFPFFCHIDEVQHTDTLLRYAAGQLPSPEQTSFLPETVHLNVYYGSPEFNPNASTVPVVSLPENLRKEALVEYLRRKQELADKVINHEALQPPTYYLLAGAWMNLGRWLGLEEIDLLYWVRLLGALLFGGMIVFGYRFVGMAAPERQFLRLSVPALLAVVPQDIFYFINNDVVAGFLFALGLELLWRWHRDGGRKVAFAAGVVVGLIFVAKATNVMIFPVVAVFLAVRWLSEAAPGQRLAETSLAILGFALPVLPWAIYAYTVCGELFGTQLKIDLYLFEPQTLNGLKAHPLFTASGFFTFVTAVSGCFWRGEVHWQEGLMHHEFVDGLLLGSSVVFLTASLIATMRGAATQLPRLLAVVCWSLVLGGIGVLLGITLGWDYSRAVFYPSKEFPYMVSGRLMNGTLVAFAILFLDGLWRCTARFGRWATIGVAVGILLTLIGSELVQMLAVFDSPYNAWHLND